MSAELIAKRDAASLEIMGRFPGLVYERSRLASAGIRPTGVLLPARLNVPYDGPDATNLKATFMGLPVTWSETEQWGLVINLPQARCQVTP